jgi:hypothetical protein
MPSAPLIVPPCRPPRTVRRVHGMPGLFGGARSRTGIIRADGARS